MDELTNRQLKILKNIIEEYIETAEPVGSELLDKKFSLGVSPATIRNEMAELTRLGYLTQPHTSAGRSPTPKALKLYINKLMQPKNLSVTDEVKIKEKVWDYKTEFQKALREATRELAESSKALAVSADSEGDAFYAGTANILDMPEFFDIDLTRNVLGLLDRFDYLDRIFSQATLSTHSAGSGQASSGQADDSETFIMLGEDLGYDYLSPCGLVFTKFGKDKKYQGVIGVLGPYRLNYQRVVPTVKYFGDLINELETGLV